MANLFLNLPLPALNGAGAAVDVSAMGSPKTIVVNGTFDEASISVEISVDGGTTYAPLPSATFQGTGAKTLPCAAQFMRTQVSGRKTILPFSATVDVGANDAGAQFAAIAMPAGNGPGAATDVSAFGEQLTFIAGGEMPEAGMVIEGSADGAGYAPITSFYGGGGISSLVATVNYLRANISGRRTGVPFSAVLAVGGVNDSSSVVDFAPSRTLFVAKSWPVGADPLVHFTTISAALVQALALGPNNTDLINILIYSGTYTEDLVLVSNVNLVGMSAFFTTKLNGDVTWTPGTGVNAPQTSITEAVTLSYINLLNAADVLTFDSSLKTSGAAQMNLEACTLLNATVLGRAGSNTNDSLFFYNCGLLNGTYTFTNMSGATPGVEIVSTRFRGFTAAGDATVRVQGGECLFNASALATITVTDTAQVFLQGLNIGNPMSVLSTPAGGLPGLTANGCVFNPSVALPLCTLTVGAGASADIRDTNFQDNVRLIGPGTINRSLWNDTTVVTTGVPLAVVFDVPYPEASYNVFLQLESGPGDPAAAIAAASKTATGFTITSAVGGNIYDYTVIQE